LAQQNPVLGVGAVTRFTLILMLMKAIPLWLAVGLAVVASGCGGMFNPKGIAASSPRLSREAGSNLR